jgi:hypothetical protein
VRTQEASLDRRFEDTTSPKTVGWADVSIHSHEIELGDNPAVSNGPPVAISWLSFESRTVSIDDYEENKVGRRTRQEMCLPPHVRDQILKQRGYSRGELREAEEKVLLAKVKRRKSARDWRLTWIGRCLIDRERPSKQKHALDPRHLKAD